MINFESFPKIPRLRRDCVITEKIDGTNAQIYIYDEDGAVKIQAGSRSRWITPEADNFGFAKWVAANSAELIAGLGIGRHFGEFWGNGIQRGYGLKNGDKRFSLFNVHKWGDDAARPACCGVVPVLYQGPFRDYAVEAALERLHTTGSAAAPFMNPEGIVVFHAHSGTLFKVTLENDAAGKGQ